MGIIWFANLLTLSNIYCIKEFITFSENGFVLHNNSHPPNLKEEDYDQDMYIYIYI